MIPFELTLDTLPLPPPGGVVRRRLAVRAVIFRRGFLLMIRSQVNGDWKFPGGGVNPGELPDRALVREVAEETGYRTRGPFPLVGTAWERSTGREIKGSMFIAESRYFTARVTGEPQALHLDEYEQKLGFAPEWTTLGQVLADNRQLLASGPPASAPWLTRETRVMELLTLNLDLIR